MEQFDFVTSYDIFPVFNQQWQEKDDNIIKRYDKITYNDQDNAYILLSEIPNLRDNTQGLTKNTNLLTNRGYLLFQRGGYEAYLVQQYILFTVMVGYYNAQLSIFTPFLGQESWIFTPVVILHKNKYWFSINYKDAGCNLIRNMTVYNNKSLLDEEVYINNANVILKYDFQESNKKLNYCNLFL